jgi:hypothetical protein
MSDEFIPECSVVSCLTNEGTDQSLEGLSQVWHSGSGLNILGVLTCYVIIFGSGRGVVSDLDVVKKGKQS